MGQPTVIRDAETPGQGVQLIGERQQSALLKQVDLDRHNPPGTVSLVRLIGEGLDLVPGCLTGVRKGRDLRALRGEEVMLQ